MAKKKTILDFKQMKANGEKITYLTAYDYLVARYEERAGIDMILVGDSIGNVQLGVGGTIPVTMDNMITAAKSVRNGAPNTFIVGDMPFMSYQVSDEEAVRNAGRFFKEAGVDCIKLEGFSSAALSRVKAITEAGMVVMGHIGLTPQLGSQLGGNKAQGKSAEAALQLIKACQDLEKAGAFAVLVEAVPTVVCKAIRESVSIPVLSIGAGPEADGQLLIYADMLGFFDDFFPKFVKKYANIGEIMQKAFAEYVADVKECRFPIDGEHTYKISAEEAAALEEELKKG
jgi:3-methyl-2-oxobutanoate hydroxymethyltransferase